MSFRKIFLIFFSVVILIASSTTLVSAGTVFCCGGDGSSDVKQCFGISRDDNNCPTGIKQCNGSVPNTSYTDDAGKTVNYHPDCFVSIKAPSTVRITDFGKLFSGAVAFLLLIAFLLAFFYLILGGISWLTSGGDKAAVETARNKIIAAIIGLIIVAATWALFQLIGGAIGFNILQGFEVPRLF